MEYIVNNLGSGKELKNVVKSLTGWDPGSEFLSPIPSAVIVYLSIYFIGLICHSMTRLITPRIIRPYILDFIKTATICAYPFGHGIMRKFYGEPGYIFAAVPMAFITLVTLREGDASPLSVWEKYFTKAIPIWKCVLKTVVQIAAGFSAYHLGMNVMSMKLHPMYAERLKAYYDQFCLSDLNVPVYAGFLIEFFAVIYDSWFSSQTFTGKPHIDLIIKIFNGCLLVATGVHLTGMYIHPAMASGLTWGCGDTTHLEHIFIYWVGPMIGTWLGVKLQRKFSIRSKQTAKKGKSENRSKKSNNNNNNNNNNSKDVTESNGQSKKARRRYFNK
ncbi:60S ribosomal protein L10 [Mactra antiquata]